MVNTRVCALLVLLAAVAPLAGGATRARAHPHVWITVETEVLYEKGAFTGLRHRWIFDEFYTAMAIEGLDKNGDGAYDREELAELAKINVEGLKDFTYFTFPQLAGQQLKIGEARDYFLEHKDGILALYFTVPFEQPLLAQQIRPPVAGQDKGFEFSVYDPTYFIAFDLAKTEPAVKLSAGAPRECKVKIGVPVGDGGNAAALEQALGALGPVSTNKTISVECEIVVAAVTPPAPQPKRERPAAASPPAPPEARRDPVEPRADVRPEPAEPRREAAAPPPEVRREPAESRPATAGAVVGPEVAKPRSPVQQAAAVGLKKRAQVHPRPVGTKRRAKATGWSRWHCFCAPRFVLARSACRW